MLAAALIILAYLCGSLPTGVWAARRTGVDVRRTGSGNIGATNVARTAGLRPALLTLIGDVVKGLLPVLLARSLSGDPWLIATVGLAAFCGHLFSVFLRFSGGKGVATALGVFLGLAPGAIALSLLAFVVVAWSTRFVSLASVVAALLVPLTAAAMHYPVPTICAGVVAAAFIVVRHRENLARLRRGEEPKFSVKR